MSKFQELADPLFWKTLAVIAAVFVVPSVTFLVVRDILVRHFDERRRAHKQARGFDITLAPPWRNPDRSAHETW